MPECKENALEVRVYAAQRSGHHGVIGWLKGHFSGEVLHFNHVSHWSRDETVHSASPGNRRDCYILNVENAGLEKDPGHIERNSWGTFAGPSARIEEMLVLRDPYNLLASHFSLWGSWTAEEKLEIWKRHALEFVGRTAFLPKKAIKVSFNAWFRDEPYRRALSERLGLKFTDRTLNEEGNSPPWRTRFGDGGSARRLGVLDRWRKYASDPFYARLFDAGIRALAVEIFPGFVDEAATAVENTQ